MQSQIAKMEKTQSLLNYADDLEGTYSVPEFINHFPSQLSWSDNKSISHLKIFWRQDHHIQSKNDKEIEAIKGKIKTALQGLDIFLFPTLVQLWAPKTIGSQQFLVTSDLPFGINLLRKGLCLYRKLCLDYKFSLDCEDDLGPLGRVFRNGFPEFSPYVSFYSAKEFKQRDAAVSCGLYGYLALPVIESVGNHCACVLELITVWDGNHYLTDIIGKVSEALKTVGFGSGNMSWPVDMEKSSQHEFALSEIEKGLTSVCHKHNIPFAQTWFTSIGENYLGNAMCTNQKGSCMLVKSVSSFQKNCIRFGLRKGQGVVWRAFTSRAPFFCKDVKQLSTSEYPLVLSARKVDLTGSFAICLQSKCTRNDVYVLEFFLPSNKEPQTLLHSLLIAVQQHFQSFEVASKGPETDDELDSVKFYAPTRSRPLLRFSQNQVETLHEGRKSSSTKHDDVVALPNKEGIENAPEYKSLGSGKELEDVGCKSHVSQSGQKHITETRGMNKPSNKRKAGHSLSQQDVQCAENQDAKSCERDQACATLTPEEGTTSVAQSAAQAAETESTIMIKASFKEDIIKFQLSLSSGIMKFENEVAKRLKLKAGSFKAKYQNEDNNCISLVSDADLQNIMCNMISQKKHTVKLLLEPVQSHNLDRCNNFVACPMPETTQMQNDVIMTIKATYRDDIVKFQLSSLSGLLELKGEIIKRFKLKCDNFEINCLSENNEWTPVASDADLQHCMTTARSVGTTTIRFSLTDGLPQTAAASVAPPMPQAIDKQIESPVVIKATYKEDIIKFELSPSSGLMELKEEVTKRLKLSCENFEVKYQDEDNNWIYLLKDTDLQKHLAAMKLSDKSAVRLHVEPIKN